MRFALLTFITSSLVIAAIGVLVVLSALDSPQPAQGVGGPQGKAVTVNTPLENDTDGLCSLSEAIIATNNENTYDGCDAFGSEQGGTDYITFDIGEGTPVINITSSLPGITDKLNMNGNTGQSTKVELHGPGTGTGLSVSYAGANGSVISNLVVNNFVAGVYINSADNVTIRGSYIGTNAAGTAAVPNGTGIVIDGTTGVHIGGTAGVTLTGPCSGECNLISGNTDVGIKVGGSGASGVAHQALIEGNFIGTDVQGSNAIGNQRGVWVNNGDATIGGATAESGNLISGNALYGVDVQLPIVLQANRIGTTAFGNAPLPNGTGVYVHNHSGDLIGVFGGVPNVISGNTLDGLYINVSNAITVQNNLIGIGADGSSSVPNGNDGINLRYVHSSFFGGTGAGEANTIAYNGADGINVGLSSDADTIRGNSIFANAGKGIHNSDNGSSGKGNDGLPPPVITLSTYSEVYGVSGCFGCQVDIFSDGGDEGRIYEGSTIVDTIPLPFGWTFIGQVQGPNITATITDSDGNTSEFSLPFTLPATPTPTPAPSPSPTSTATPTATPTAAGPTPTPTASANHTQGDVNCVNGVNHDDFWLLLQYAAKLANGVTPGICPDLAGGSVGGFPWGDLNCDGLVNAIDALFALAYELGIFLPPVTGNCVPIGHTLT